MNGQEEETLFKEIPDLKHFVEEYSENYLKKKNRPRNPVPPPDPGLRLTDKEVFEKRLDEYVQNYLPPEGKTVIHWYCNFGGGSIPQPYEIDSCEAEAIYCFHNPQSEYRRDGIYARFTQAEKDMWGNLKTCTGHCPCQKCQRLHAYLTLIYLKIEAIQEYYKTKYLDFLKREAGAQGVYLETYLLHMFDSDWQCGPSEKVGTPAKKPRLALK